MPCRNDADSGAHRRRRCSAIASFDNEAISRYVASAEAHNVKATAAIDMKWGVQLTGSKASAIVMAGQSHVASSPFSVSSNRQQAYVFAE